MSSEPTREAIILSTESKQDARDDRMTIRKTKEELLRRKFYQDAIHKCDPIVQKFVECSKEAGYLVVFKCREQNKAMGECINQHYSDELFVKHLAEMGIEKSKPKTFF